MQFKRIMERAKIKGRLLREANGEGRSQSSLSFHSLRHCFNHRDGKRWRRAGTPAEAYRPRQRENERAIHASRA